MINKVVIVCVFALLVSTKLWADEAVPNQPRLPERLQSGQPLEPEVNIIHKKETTIQEYRIHGKLYMIKVTPIVGPSYYLVDNNGDGAFGPKQFDLDSPAVPQWVLYQW